MSFSNSFETALLSLLFNNANIANLGDATGVRGSSTAGNLWISLHTGDPGEAGDQTSNEANYAGYSRKSLARASGAGGFTVAGNTVSNTSALAFDPCTGGNNTITHFAIGRDQNGAGQILIKGAITNPPAGLTVSNGITPQFNAGQLSATLD